MIAYPETAGQLNGMKAFIKSHALVNPTDDMYCIGWFDPATLQLLMVAAFNAHIGSLCQIHIACAPGFHFTPRAMLREVFSHAFDRMKVTHLLGVVNSLNTRAMKYDLHLGFKEVVRFKGTHDDGGDLVMLTMERPDCRYLQTPARKAA